jgi:hypothetical protein
MTFIINGKLYIVWNNPSYTPFTKDKHFHEYNGFSNVTFSSGHSLDHYFFFFRKRKKMHAYGVLGNKPRTEGNSNTASIVELGIKPISSNEMKKFIQMLSS